MKLPSAETFAFTLTLGGRYAGEQEWVTGHERGVLVARVQTDFGGVLPEVRRVQTSRMQTSRIQMSRMQPGQLSSQPLSSLGYSEGDGRGRASFETVFDPRAGLVTLRQGREEVQAPLTTEYHDPVSLLLWLRTLGEQDRAEAHLTGGKALIQRLPDSEVDGVPAYGYFVRPGGAYVYVEQEEPRRLLRLIQPTDFGAIEANTGSAKRQSGSGGRGRRRAG